MIEWWLGGALLALVVAIVLGALAIVFLVWRQLWHAGRRLLGLQDQAVDWQSVRYAEAERLWLRLRDRGGRP